MSAPYLLRENAEELTRAEERLTSRIEDAEKEIVELRRRRDEVRFHRAESLAAANVLDNMHFRVERNPAGGVDVSIDPGAATREGGESR